MFLGDDNEKLRTFRVSTDVARMNEYIKLQTSQIVNLCKVFESIVREKGLMGEHLEVHKLTERFVKNKSCLTNLLVFIIIIIIKHVLIKVTLSCQRHCRGTAQSVILCGLEAVTIYLDSRYPVDVI